MRRRSLIVRVWLDEAGALYGQVIDPLNEERRGFRSPEELWEAVANLASAAQEFPSDTPHDP